jgi:alkyl hydroperoxide reductase subunit F
MYDVIIIGGGPAGVAGGIYASRKRLNSLLLTNTFGGQSINSGSIENFIGFPSLSGTEFAKVLEDHLRAQDHIEIKDGVWVKGIREQDDGTLVVSTNDQEYHTKNLLYTLGSKYRRLNVPGEDEFEGKGVFYCSICDAPLMKDKPVAVIGGGNSGMEAVVDLLPYASKMYVLQRSDALKADEVYQERIKKEDKVEVLLNAETTEITGDTLVQGLSYTDKETGEQKHLEVNGVFVAIGWVPNAELIKDLVEVNDHGHVVVDHKTYKTSHPHIWAAGDVTDIIYKQINPAMGDAIKAVLSIYDAVEGRNPKK